MEQNNNDNNNNTSNQNDDFSVKSEQQFVAKDLPVDKITVYNDRAEVTRYLKASLNETGVHELKIQGLSPLVEMNSIRVSGASGEATILEVSPSVRYTHNGNCNSTSQEEDLKKEEKILMEEIQVAQETLNRITKQTEWLEGWAKNALGGQSKMDDKNNVMHDFLSHSALQLATNFMDYYSAQLENLNNKNRQTNQVVRDMKDRLTAVQEQLRQFQSPPSTKVIDVCVSLSCAKETEIELEISYLIRNASWVASYDCRVNSSGNSVQLIYYGSITNSTGEDWNKVHLNLSTASPSSGGSPPDLQTVKVQFPQPVISGIIRYESESMPVSGSLRRAKRASTSHAESLSVPQPMAVLTATATENTSSTTFNIQRMATIAADSKPHKVTIAILDNLEPRFSYTTVPSKSLTAFLKVAATNTTTQFPLLKGQINVFMDNNFITTSSLKHVSPGEEFDLFLGADAGIKVEYDPVKTFTEVQGACNKVNVTTTTRRILVKNNKKIEVSVCIIDQLPLSSDERIKVRLVEPVITTGMKEDIKINKQNNVEWRYIIPSKGTKEIAFVYEIEYPKDKTIESYQDQ